MIVNVHRHVVPSKVIEVFAAGDLRGISLRGRGDRRTVAHAEGYSYPLLFGTDTPFDMSAGSLAEQTGALELPGADRSAIESETAARFPGLSPTGGLS